MSVLLSVKPVYSKKIFSGEKKFEFRKQKPKFLTDMVFVYESSPTRGIVGEFRIKMIHSGTPKRIWQKCKEASGIEESVYLNYCNGTKIIHAFEIDEAFRFESPIDPFAVFPDFKPPQSFSYFKNSSLFKMLENNQRERSHAVVLPKCFYRKFEDK